MKQIPYLKPYLKFRMKVQFKITKKISGKKSPILLLIYNKMFGGAGVLYYGTGVNILPEYFDTASQRPTKNKVILKSLDRETIRDFQNIEDMLNEIQGAARILIDQITYNNLKLDSAQFKEKLEQLLHPSNEISDQTQIPKPSRKMIAIDSDQSQSIPIVLHKSISICIGNDLWQSNANSSLHFSPK